jgi:SAM-dependent methyltransferase
LKAVVEAEHRERGEQHWWFRGRRQIFARLLDAAVPLPAGARILDLGPGCGVNLPLLRPRGQVTALDLSRESLLDCAERGADWVVRADATAPPLRDGTFDLVCALDVLEHLADDATALTAWHRLLKPHGRLLLTVPALPILWGRQDVLSGHRRRYRRAELARRVTAAGFAIERLTYFNALLLPPILAVRLLMRPFVQRAVRRGGSDLSMGSFGMDGLLYRALASEGRWLLRRDLPIGVSLLCLARLGGGKR